MLFFFGLALIFDSLDNTRRTFILAQNRRAVAPFVRGQAMVLRRRWKLWNRLKALTLLITFYVGGCCYLIYSMHYPWPFQQFPRFRYADYTTWMCLTIVMALLGFVCRFRISRTLEQIGLWASLIRLTTLGVFLYFVWLANDTAASRGAKFSGFVHNAATRLTAQHWVIGRELVVLPLVTLVVIALVRRQRRSPARPWFPDNRWRAPRALRRHFYD